MVDPVVAATPPRHAPRPTDAVPSTALVLLAVGSVQIGAALAKSLFEELGPAGTVFLRVGLAAVLLTVLWRPRVRGLARADLRLVAAFGLALAGMNLSFYAALDRLPLGIAVTIEFVGPLGVAVALSRRRADLAWVLLAALGVLLLAEGGGDVDPLGVLLALTAGAFWAAYILLSSRVGRAFAGGQGLALAMVAGTAVLVPVGVADGGTSLLDPGLLALGAAVALLSSAIPYSLELEALRRLPERTFGILLSTEPAVAALAGFVILGERLAARELVAMGLVVVACVGAARAARPGGEGRSDEPVQAGAWAA
jgi:inner membrane transporter RhtA